MIRYWGKHPKENILSAITPGPPDTGPSPPADAREADVIEATMRRFLLAILMLFFAGAAFCAEKAPGAPAKDAVSFPITMYENVDMFRQYFPVDDEFFIRLTYAETFSPISMASIVKIEAGACCGAPETMESEGCLSTLFEGKVGVLDRLEADRRKGEIVLRTMEFDTGTNDFTTPKLRKFPFTFTCGK